MNTTPNRQWFEQQRLHQGGVVSFGRDRQDRYHPVKEQRRPRILVILSSRAVLQSGNSGDNCAQRNHRAGVKPSKGQKHLPRA